MQKITPFLWFDGKAEEAAKFYVSVFRNSKMGKLTRYGEGGPGQKGSVMTAEFEIDGQHFVALNGGPQFKLTEAVSLVQMCGWLKDRFGLSWQIVPSVLPQLLGDPDPAKARRVMKAMLQMKKLDIKGLKQAYEWQ